MYCISVLLIIHFSKKWIFERLCWITGPCMTIQKDPMFISMKHFVGCWNWFVTYFQVSFIWKDTCPLVEILFTSLLCKPSPQNCMETRYISKTLMKPLERPGVYASLPPLNLLGLDGRVYLSGMISGMARASVVPRANSPLIRWIEDGRTHLLQGVFGSFWRHVQGLEVRSNRFKQDIGSQCGNLPLKGVEDVSFQCHHVSVFSSKLWGDSLRSLEDAETGMEQDIFRFPTCWIHVARILGLFSRQLVAWKKLGPESQQFLPFLGEGYATFALVGELWVTADTVYIYIMILCQFFLTKWDLQGCRQCIYIYI